MKSFFAKYKQAVEHQHGWDVELKCIGCGWSGVPIYDGWTPSYAMNFGNSPTIYANITCPECGKDLREEAGSKLVELFEGITLDRRNKRYLMWFVIALIGIPLIIAGLIEAGVQAKLWGNIAFIALVFMPLFLMPGIMLLNYRIGLISSECECGGTGYIFIGMLGRSYCYRCPSCGKLLRVRD
jgi:hypothetical protein